MWVLGRQDLWPLARYFLVRHYSLLGKGCGFSYSSDCFCGYGTMPWYGSFIISRHLFLTHLETRRLRSKILTRFGVWLWPASLLVHRWPLSIYAGTQGSNTLKGPQTLFRCNVKNIEPGTSLGPPCYDSKILLTIHENTASKTYMLHAHLWSPLHCQLNFNIWLLENEAFWGQHSFWPLPNYYILVWKVFIPV